jgi:ribonuclease P protein component
LIRRIRDRRSFLRLQREGVRVRSRSLWCTYLSDPTATPPRVAFAIGRAMGTATVRNRLRRRLRALLDQAARSNTVPPGLLLIGALPSAVELTYDQLLEDVTTLLNRLR